jgi:hypothetical protein
MFSFPFDTVRFLLVTPKRPTGKDLLVFFLGHHLSYSTE